MIAPAALQQGDTIAIISTARKISAEELVIAIQTFTDWGLHVVTGPHLFNIDHQFAGTDDHRLADLHWALQHPEVKAIVCARGGYGTTRFVDRVNLSLLTAHPKWICGFSDVTALLGSIHHTGVEAVHSTMPIFFDGKTTPASIESLRKALFGEAISYTAPTHSLNQTGTAQGTVIGGNLSILVTCIGTASDMNYDGKILFMEDLDEYLYHVDRMMVQLDRSGKLARLAGLIIGSMSRMRDNAIPFGATAEEIILHHAGKYGYPIAFGFPVGHEMDNHAMICGRTALLQVNDEGTQFRYLS